MASLISSPRVNLPETNFKEKVRCGEVYRNLNGNEMFQKFYYRCLECSMDFESSPEFEEHVIAHYLQDDEDCSEVHNIKNNENVISISSDDDEEEEEENGYLYAFEVASLVEENVSENDLPLPLMQMLEHSTESCDQAIHLSEESDEEDDRNVVFPCEGLRKQALHQYSEYCCTQCPAYFNTKTELNFHLHVHTLPNTMVCPHCYEAFPNVLKLNEHISLTKKKRLRKSKHIEKNCKRAKEDDTPQQKNDVVKMVEENQCNTDLKETKNISEGIPNNVESSEQCEENILMTNSTLNVSTNASLNVSAHYKKKTIPRN